MTVHIALAEGDHGVLLSDSQGTSDNSESHGLHKQFVGKNFAVGVAGYSPIITRLFDHLSAYLKQDREQQLGDVVERIENFYRDEIRPPHLDRSAVLALGYEEGEVSVREFEPGVFTRFGEPVSFACIGTGASFVSRAITRNMTLGHVLPTSSLVDMLVSASHYADAACESVTVDDSLAVAMLDRSRCYLLGDAALDVRYAPASIRKHWASLARRWQELQAMITAIDTEITEAQRLFSKILSKELLESDCLNLRRSSRGALKTREQFRKQLKLFQDEYDLLLAGGQLPLPIGDPI